MQGKWNHQVGRPDLPGVQEAIAQALADRTPGGVRPGELDRGGRALRWLEAGHGGVAPVVLIAGSGSSGLTWAPVLPELARHGRVVAYDRAGLGASEPDRAPGPTLDGQLADLAALVRHLGAGPAVLVGHSWGGLLAQLLAWKRPELVAGLVLVDPTHEEFRPRAISAAEAVLNRIWLFRTALAPAARDQGEALDRAEAAVIAHPHQRRTILAENRLTDLVVPELRRRRAAGRLPDVPVRVLSATVGLPRTMRERWTAMQAWIATGATLGEHIVVPGAGHAVHEDRPQAVIAAVLEVSDHARYARNS
ncbi:alpha/beta fold hydrolase [Kitasatospora sp. SUK 42]|uniref:alpha/beta fold hydrolase n=1 Tax=Kitasatospora sp. SUK 42 TaxID=1588882 RepID=UPI0018CB174B|nr:alpha/beta hydrolase [Kitasatospora sp. SUK 42]MBV2156281.1 alpha/beta hydrolase [Kitasatospora sp. SUK 42]